SMESMWQRLGVGHWDVYVSPPSFFQDVVYRGQKGSFGMDCARTKLGKMDLELIQPTEGQSPFSDFLKDHGEGIHHFGWMVVPDLAGAIRTMESKGFPCLMTARIPGIRFAYFDTTTVLGALLEAFELDKSAKPRKPDRVWPEPK
ncbi:MAG: VOC family protein, partial [Dehalococcoidia bacterium]|nr:VOC family protein [Dehalococcoidia bacterium]